MIVALVKMELPATTTSIHIPVHVQQAIQELIVKQVNILTVEFAALTAFAEVIVVHLKKR